jgi:hypothetical protein
VSCDRLAATTGRGPALLARGGAPSGAPRHAGDGRVPPHAAAAAGGGHSGAPPAPEHYSSLPPSLGAGRGRRRPALLAAAAGYGSCRAACPCKGQAGAAAPSSWHAINARARTAG